jgi:hypothetical protein
MPCLHHAIVEMAPHLLAGVPGECPLIHNPPFTWAATAVLCPDPACPAACLQQTVCCHAFYCVACTISSVSELGPSHQPTAENDCITSIMGRTGAKFWMFLLQACQDTRAWVLQVRAPHLLLHRGY